MPTVKEFITQSYRLISASSPTQPLQGDDLSLGVLLLNQLLSHYAASGLLLTIAKTETTTIVNNQQTIICAPADFTPTPEIVGRLSNLNSAWILLNGVTYPLIEGNRDEFLASFRYNPLAGLPRFIYVFQQAEYTELRLYPAPSQSYEFYIRGKFELTSLAPTDSMNALPSYYYRFALFSVARDIALFKGRADAWTDKLEARYIEARDLMESASEVNLSITGEDQSLLNGAYRVQAGV